MASLVALVLYYRIVERRWHRTHVITALVAVSLGGLTLVVRDPMFIKYKPTAIYGGFAVALAISHFWGDRVLLQRFPQKLVDLPSPLWRKVNASWSIFFAACALVNVLLVEILTDEQWVLTKTFGFPAAWFIFILAHLPVASPYMNSDENSSEKNENVVRDSGT